MIKHHGQIVERLVRKNNYNITELARHTAVNRGMVYQWFNQKYLKADIIYRIGCIMNYDFSEEFPEFFTKNDFKAANAPDNLRASVKFSDNQGEQDVWKDKYVSLLEKYSQLLSDSN
ncbi:hypothetical protein [Mucilaginibacter sp. SP1R1]|uniref:hypothetical protein n=1 Tax=Mucilaginibacter sp. SP1R1 TaxID=2723091 RepID=UPI00161BDE1E|nr:hypothetical protein [Mucilaginibacter sp. SP1R1]MBB6149079.1 hypothetical protein [Mucilaginibacter sp. SP1R1]